MNHVRSSYDPDASAAASGKEPKSIPTTKEEFDALPFPEKLWLYYNSPVLYRRFTDKQK